MPEIEDPLSVEAPASGAGGPVRNVQVPDAPSPEASFAEGQSREGEGSNAAQAAGQVVTVDWNGAQRQMPLQELTQLAQQAHRALEIESSARTMLREDTELQALRARMQQFDPEDQQALGEFLVNPKGFRRPGAAAAVRQEVEAQAMNAQQNGVNPQIATQLEVLTNSMRVLLEREQAREVQTQAQTREQRVDELMSSFPVFKDGHPSSSAARGIARRGILAELASSPGASVEDVVAQQAASWNAVLAGETQQSGQQQEVVTWPSGGQPVSNQNQQGSPPQNIREAGRRARARLGL